MRSPELRSGTGKKYSRYVRKVAVSISAVPSASDRLKGNILIDSVRLEIKSLYAGTKLRGWWLILGPLILSLLYIFIYSVVLEIRAPDVSRTQYVAILIASLTTFLALSQSMGLGVTSLTSNKNLIQNTRYPIELIPLRLGLIASVTPLVGLSLSLFIVAWSHGFALSMLLLPVVWASVVFMSVSLVGVFGILAIYWRDLQAIVLYLILIGMVSSPIVYTLNMVPSNLKFLIFLNPLSYFIFGSQYVVVGGATAGVGLIFGLFAVSGFSALFVIFILRRFKSRIANDI